MSNVSIYTVTSNKPERQFSISVGGNIFEGPFDADSRAGEANFLALISALRKEDAIVRIGKQTFKIPVSNAAKKIPLPGSKKFGCNTMFSS